MTMQTTHTPSPTSSPQEHAELNATVALLEEVGSGKEIILSDRERDSRYFANFEPDLNPEQSKVFLDATISCMRAIRAREQNDTDYINLNDLPQIVHSHLCRYVEGTIKAASDRNDVDFEELRKSMAEWRELIQEITDANPRYYPRFVIAKTKILEMLVADCEQSGGSPKDNYGKEESPSYQALVAAQRAALIPQVQRVTRSGTEEIQFQQLELASESAKTLEVNALELVVNLLSSSRGADHDRYLVTWENSSSTARGVVVNGKPISHMQHGMITSRSDNSMSSEEIGYYDRISRNAGERGREHAVVIKVPRGSTITIDEAQATKDYYEPLYY